MKAAIDASPDASKAPACKPNPAWVYSLAEPATTNIDFIHYSLLATGGIPDPERERTVLFEVGGSSTLTKALYWTHPNIEYSEDTAFRIRHYAGFPLEKPEAIATSMVRGAANTKTVIVTKDRTAGAGEAGADAFVVTLEPPQIVCALQITVSLGVGGTDEKTERVETYNTKTLETVKVEDKTTGGHFTIDPYEDIQRELHAAVREKLGLAY